MTVRPDALEPADVTRALLEQYAHELHTAFPARVQEYRAASQRADLVPLIKHPVPQPDGSVDYEDLPVLPDVPIVFPRAGSWFLSFPIAAGDFVLVVCQEAAAGHWEAGDGDAQYPGDLRRHHLAHAVALPGYYPARRALENADAAALILGHDGGFRLAIKADGTAELPEGSAVYVALANLVDQRLAAIQSAFDTHTHVVAGTANLTSGTVAGTAAPTTAPVGPLASVAAQKVKAT